MKVTVTKYLNVRVGKPSLNAPCYQYLAPGSEIEVDGKLYKGDKEDGAYEGINTWFKDEAGNYYWSGGFDNANLKNQLLTGISEKWWLKKFNIPEIWSKGITGKGIRIAVLDTGISYPHIDLNLEPKLFNDVTKSASGINDIDGHGTHCTGIIKAMNNDSGAIGLAYNSMIYVCKITHDTQGDKNEYLIQGLKWAIAQGVDIISISKGDPFGDKNLELAINEADSKGILVIASAGNLVPGYPSDHIYYPARYKTTISVGGIDEKDNPLKDSLLTNETDIYAPGNEILSTYKNNDFVTLSGSSQAAPFIAGVCALILEHQRIKDPSLNAKKIKEIILKHAISLSFGKKVNLDTIFN